MTPHFCKIPPTKGFYLFWEKVVTGFAEVTIGQYINYVQGQECYFQVAGSEMDFRPGEDRTNDWYYGPLDIEVPELPQFGDAGM